MCQVQTNVCCWHRSRRTLSVGVWQLRVESVSSLMQEAAVELLDAAIVSCPPYCRRRTRRVPVAAQADDLPSTLLGSMAAFGALPTLECPPASPSERPFMADF